MQHDCVHFRLRRRRTLLVEVVSTLVPRRHAALNIFMLADDARLSAFVDNVARRNGGRVLQAGPEHLGEYVIRDFLRTRGAGRR